MSLFQGSCLFLLQAVVSQAELADSRARVARRDAQLAALAQGGLSAHGRGLVDELIRAAGTLTRQKALYRAAFGAAQLELNYRAGAVPGCETPAERGQRLARLQTAAVADIQQVRSVLNQSVWLRALELSVYITFMPLRAASIHLRCHALLSFAVMSGRPRAR